MMTNISVGLSNTTKNGFWNCLVSLLVFSRCMDEAMTIPLWGGACVSTEVRESLGARTGYAVSLSLTRHAWRVVKDRVQAEGRQID